MRNLFIIPLIIISILLSACGSAVPKMKPFKMDIQQGNVVTSKMLLQLRPGMTKSQVKFIMGTPLIVDSFHSNRWDYFYQMRQSGKVIEQRRVILDFEKELLVRVRGDVVPQGTPGAEPAQDGNTLASAKSVNPTPVKQVGLMEKLKFWKSDEKQAVNGVKPKKEKDLFDTFKFWEKDEADEAKDAAAAVVTPSKSVEATADLATQEAPSLLAVPIAGVSPVETPKLETPVVEPAKEKSIVAAPVISAPEPVEPEPVAPEVKVAEPVAEMPKVEAPQVGAPQVEAPNIKAPKTETLAQEVVTPVIATPVVAAPAVEAVIESAPASEPANKMDKDEPFIFRMDKKLNLKNLENSPTKAVIIKDKTKKADVAPPEPLEEPGYFERILEKIGF